MAKVLGVGGLFFKSRDGDAMRDWYRRVLGVEFKGWGGAVFLPDAAAAQPGAATVFSPFKHDTEYFAPVPSAPVSDRCWRCAAHTTGRFSPCAATGRTPSVTSSGQAGSLRSCGRRSRQAWF